MIDQLTKHADSLYYPDVQPQEIEGHVVAKGAYVGSPKAHKVYKICEFPEMVGASSGEPSKWVKIEATNGEYHGRPITGAQYHYWLTKQIPCC